jgi:hypothetical protein
MFEDQSIILGPSVVTITGCVKGLTASLRRKILDSAVGVVSGGIVYAHGAPGHTDCCGTRRSDSHVRAL